jgi:cytochrome P450
MLPPLVESNQLSIGISSIVGLTALLVCLTVYFNSNSYKNKKQDDRPPVAPAGILKTVQSIGAKDAPFFVEEMAKKTGSDIYRIRLPLPYRVYVVGDPTTTREILLDKETDKPEATYESFDNIAGAKNMFTRRNDMKWHASRKGTRNAFASTEIHRMNRICTEHVDQWIKNKLEHCIDTNESFDPSHEMVRITFGVILEAAFEFSATDEEYEHFSHHLEVALKEFVLKGSTNPFRKIFGPLLSEYRTAKKSCVHVQAFARKILDAYRKNENKSSNNTVIKLIVENESFADDKHRVAEIVTMLIAGHDTTGYTLGTTLMMLAKHPKVSEKLTAELLSMDVANRSRSEYLRAVITESQRLLPVAAMGSIRQVGREISCKGGSMVIPKDSIIFLPQFLLLRCPTVYKDPCSFRPERWEDADKSMRDAFMNFSLGNRNCIGQSLAVAEMYSIIPTLLAKYSFEVEEEGELDYFLTLKYVGSKVKASRVNSNPVQQ